MAQQNHSVKFINPYNFIPLADDVTRMQYDPAKKRVSGVIEYQIKTKTPLFIPNTSNDHAILPDKAYDKAGKLLDEYHKSYEFFAYENLDDFGKNTRKCKTEAELLAPVIPGSEMRGLIRSQYEILSNSCFGGWDSDVVLHKRNPEVFKPGLIGFSGGKYHLYNAEVKRLGQEQGKDVKLVRHWKVNAEGKRYCAVLDKEGARIKVKKVKDSIVVKDVNGSIDGYILKGEDSPSGSNSKKYCHVFVLKDGKMVGGDNDVDIKSLDLTLKIYQDNGSGYKEYGSEWNAFKANKSKKQDDFFPVYYSVVGNHVMLSPASITQEVYSRKLEEMISGHTPCTDKKHLCPACALFGTLSNAKEKLAVTSKVRFSDLQLSETMTDTSECYEQPVSLKELSSPRISNVAFYLQKPEDAWFWTYDYYIDKNGNVKTYNAQINGRKFYWHDMSATVESAKADELTVRNVTVRPLKKGVSFTGKLYFDDITEKQLNELIYVMNAGEEGSIDQKKHGYKLGGAKPLGFGSIATNVTRVGLRNVQMDDSSLQIALTEDEYDSYMVPSWNGNAEIVDNFKKMTAFETLQNAKEKGYHLGYPLPEKNDNDGNPNIFTWFMENQGVYKRGLGNTITTPKMANKRNQLGLHEYMEALNPILVKNKSLPEVTSEAKPVRNNKIGFNRENSSAKNNNYKKGQEYIADIDGYTMDQSNCETEKIFQVKIKIEGNEERILAKYLNISTKKDFNDRKNANPKVHVRYKGTNNRGYNMWHVI